MIYGKGDELQKVPHNSYSSPHLSTSVMRVKRVVFHLPLILSRKDIRFPLKYLISNCVAHQPVTCVQSIAFGDGFFADQLFITLNTGVLRKVRSWLRYSYILAGRKMVRWNFGWSIASRWERVEFNLHEIHSSMTAWWKYGEWSFHFSLLRFGIRNEPNYLIW